MRRGNGTSCNDRSPGGCNTCPGMAENSCIPGLEGYTDDTLAMNSMISFYGYHGQGEVFLDVSEETESFCLYVNGVKAEPDGKAGILSVDISKAAKDGINTLQISNIMPLGLKNAVTVYIPYPEILPGNGESGGIHPLALKLVEDLIVSYVTFGVSQCTAGRGTQRTDDL